MKTLFKQFCKWFKAQNMPIGYYSRYHEKDILIIRQHEQEFISKHPEYFN